VRTVLDRADIKPGDVVLEVGGGSGVVLREIARRTAGSNRIIDVDINPYLLREASALAKREGLAARMEFRRGSAEAIPLDDASVDVALAVASARQAGADGADRNTEDVCGGLVRHSFEPDEQDHLALLPRQAGERLIEFAKLAPFAKAIANARAEERERCADLAKDILKKLVGPMEAGYVASKILGKDPTRAPPSSAHR
jgi:SAM-dependent methyltransferase